MLVPQAWEGLGMPLFASFWQIQIMITKIAGLQTYGLGKKENLFSYTSMREKVKK